MSEEGLLTRSFFVLQKGLQTKFQLRYNKCPVIKRDNAELVNYRYSSFTHHSKPWLNHNVLNKLQLAAIALSDNLTLWLSKLSKLVIVV